MVERDCAQSSSYDIVEVLTAGLEIQSILIGFFRGGIDETVYISSCPPANPWEHFPEDDPPRIH